MSLVKVSGNASGTGVFEIISPNSSVNRTQTLPDASGTVVLDSATQTLTNKTLTTPNINSAQFATVSGTAPIYPCRAWVNFDGTGTPAIRQSGNVSSITDLGIGLYQANFTTALPDANYTVSVTGAGDRDGSGGLSVLTIRSPSVNNTGAVSLATTSVQVSLKNQSGTLLDADVVAIAIFR